MYQTRVLRMQPTRFLNMQPTFRMMRPVPKEEHSGMDHHLDEAQIVLAVITQPSPLTQSAFLAHTISQRIRTLKKIPPELIPLGVVLGVAIGAAGFSIVRKLYTDKSLRLSRQRGHNQSENPNAS